MRRRALLAVPAALALLAAAVLLTREDRRPEMEVVASGLEVPWSIAPLGDGRYLVSERPGRIRLVGRGAARVVAELEVAHVGEGGLLGIALHPEFPSRRRLYAYHTYGRGGQLHNRVVALELDGELRAVSTRVVLDGIPGAPIHDGGRIRFGPDGRLYVTTGDAARPPLAQDLSSLAGKILRLEDDGSVPRDNPFPGSPIYSYGHRNPQGIAWHPATGRLYASEHGPVGRDEINVIVPGGNYGWPSAEEYVEPLIDTGAETWAPSGIDFAPDGRLLVACLRGEMLVEVEEGGVKRLLRGALGRLRDVVVEGDHALLATSNRDGRGRPREEDDKVVRIALDAL